MSFGNELIYFIYLIPVILLSLSFHEFSHAYFSYRLGDPTAKSMGRLTINPLKHLDILGTIMLVVSMMNGLGFGWAKPVPINPSYYRDKKKGTMLVSLAGPLSNVLLALISAFPLYYIQKKYGIPENYGFINSFELPAIIYDLSFLFYTVNIGLAVFNIIPVPPLDGSKILSGILPLKYYFKLMQYENYIGLAFLLIIFASPRVISIIMSPFLWVVQTAVRSIVSPIISLL